MHSMAPELSNQFQALRSQIEAVLKQHSVIAITSAARGDGKSLTAFGLAKHMTEAGYRCALVDGDAVDRVVHGVRTISAAPGPLSRASVKTLFAKLREDYDFAIVDCGVMTSNGNALGLCAAADAVLITVRADRSKLPADQQLVRQLNQSVSNVMGVVHIAPGAILDFSRAPVPVSDAETSTSFSAASGEKVRGIVGV
jgi:Mrp family chromosome partitioning ATPase